MTFGEAVRIYRRFKNLTQSEVAERAGISIAYLSLIERNQRDPGFKLALRISEALETSMVKITLLMDQEILADILPGGLL